MSHLLVKIDRVRKIAEFSGPGTYAARDEIKSLGQARWVNERKTWVVQQFLLSQEELSSRLRNIVIQEEVFEDDSEGEGTREQPAGIAKRAVSRSEHSGQFQSAGLFESEGPVESAGREALPPALQNGISVSELSGRVRAAIRSAFPRTILVFGVLSAVKEQRDGRVFMDLADPERPEETISCVIWRDAARLCKPLHDAGFRLEANLQVMFEVKVELSKRSSLSLQVMRIVAEWTIAKLAAQREVTNEKLRQEGLFGNNKQLTLSFLPRRLGLLTSVGGTVINDFRAALDHAEFGFELIWRDVRVQGADAKAQLMQGLRELAGVPALDAILIFRGGGSAADLAVFNEYELAKAVCLCPIPVLSAIGHQEDQSSVQDVSFRALGVPKDLGRFFADIVIERRRGFQTSITSIQEYVHNALCTQQERLKYYSRQLYSLGVRLEHGRAEHIERHVRSLPLLSETFRNVTAERLLALSRPIAALAAQTCARQEDRLASASRRAEQQGERLREQRLLAVRHLIERLLLSGRRSAERAEERIKLLPEMLRGAGELVRRQEQEVESYRRITEEASPAVQLSRGFSLVRRPQSGEFVTSGSSLESGELVEIEFKDGKKEAKIT